MSQKTRAPRNEYRCCIEINQNGKYSVRIRASYGSNGWTLPVYFLASSFDASMKKLEETLQILQRHEERLWFWGVERSDDPKLTGELLRQFGVNYDQRQEFPKRGAEISVPPARPVPAFRLAQARKTLADCISTGRQALASD